jgi:predicted small secreted protein
MNFGYGILGAAALSLAACGTMPGAGTQTSDVSETLLTATATIDSVDTEERIVRLHGDQTGQAYTVYANDGIQNLDQLEAGDVVVMEYYEATTLAMADPDAPEASATVASAKAPAGELPGGITVETESIVVQVVDYDRDEHIATYLTPDGLQRRSAVPPRLQSFAENLQRGDLVEVTLTQAVAISIDEVES